MRIIPSCLSARNSARVFRALTLLFALCITTAAAFAQLSGKGELNGTVLDQTGAVVPNAKVVVTNSLNGVSSVITTSSAGYYQLTTLDAGIYTVSVEANGFSKIVQQNVHVNTGEAQTYNPALTAGSTTETVTVSTAPPSIETSNATLGATMEQEVYNALPIQMGAGSSPDQRRATDFASLMPGVQAVTGNVTIASGSVSGSSGNASAIYLNGVPFIYGSSAGDPRFVWSAISVDSVEQFQVQTVGYSAIYEGQGVQMYTIKGGGNKIHGNVYDFFRNTALDTWGFYAPAATITNPVTHVVSRLPKPVEHMNEFGGVLSGPIWKDKMFLFANYDAYRFSHGPQAALQSLPTQAEYTGDFRDQGINIYDPTSTVCTIANVCTRTQYMGNDGITPNVIPTVKINSISQYLQHFLPQDYTLPTTIGNNFVGGYKYGLSNWTATARFDWIVSSKNSLNLVFGKGRQATAGGPAVQAASTGRNITPNAPYNYGQVYAPLTTVWILQDTHTFTSHLLNQFVYGFGRYNGPSFNPNSGGAFAATAAGISGLPAGQAANGFPNVTFAGNGTPPTSFAGNAANLKVSNHYDMIDNVQWSKGKHSITIGGQLGWVQFQNTPATGGSTFLTLAANGAETQRFSSGTTLDTTTGLPYASFLSGAIDKVSLTQYLVQETGARFRPMSFYGQDDWKISSRLTLNIGLRWDYYPSYREARDRLSFLNPNGTNGVTGNKGVAEFAGSAAGNASCNCHNLVNNYYKNFGPRVGFAYQSDAKTVWRGSFGVMYTHGNAVGGGSASAQGTGILGYSAAVSNQFTNAQTYNTSVNSMLFSSAPTIIPPTLSATYGTGYSTNLSPLVSPQSIGYGDPYYGDRAPEFVNWSFGFQHEFLPNLALTMSYVGSQGHFLQPSSSGIRGYWANQLDPKFLPVGNSLLNSSATPANLTTLGTAGFTAPNGYASFDPSQKISTYLKPFPQYAVGDTYGNTANSNYHGLQLSLIQRPRHGLNFMFNYTWSRAIDDAGTFRTGYDIPAAYAEDGKFHKADSLERSLSTFDQRHHAVLTMVYDLPFGKGALGGSKAWSRALLANYKFSGIYQAFSGSPLAITASDCGTNYASNQCYPSTHVLTAVPARINGKWGKGSTGAKSLQYINAAAFKAVAPASSPSLFPVTARTAPLNLFGPGNYDIDISLRRTFTVYHVSLLLQGDLYNITNHTQFGGITTAWTAGSTSFGQVTSQVNSSRDAQLTAKISF